jgi:hypothetical protein
MQCEFTGVDLSQASITQCGFMSCKMIKVTMDQTWASGTHIESCEFGSSRMQEMFIILSSFINSDLSNAYLDKCMFRYCIMGNNNMTGTSTTGMSTIDCSTSSSAFITPGSTSSSSANSGCSAPCGTGGNTGKYTSTKPFNKSYSSGSCSSTQVVKTCNNCQHYSFLNGICINPKVNGLKPSKKSNDTCSDWEA